MKLCGTFMTGDGDGATVAELAMALDRYGDILAEEIAVHNQPHVFQKLAQTQAVRIDLLTLGWHGFEKTNIGILDFPGARAFDQGDVEKIARVRIGRQQ